MSSDPRTWEGQDLYDDDGSKVGTIDAIYLDRDTEEPAWATVNTGLFGLSSSFVPIGDARVGDDGVVTRHSQATIKDAPRIDADGDLSEEEEQRLYQHYGVDYSPYDRDEEHDHDVDPAVNEGRDLDFDADRSRDVHGNVERSGDGTITRSEEEVHVGTTQREAGRLRLRKYVETDTVTKTVPVEREKVRVTREPVDADDGVVDGDLDEDEIEITLSEEEAVVEKRTVPKEKLRIDRDVEHDEVEVSEEVRREQFDVEGEGVASDTTISDR